MRNESLQGTTKQVCRNHQVWRRDGDITAAGCVPTYMDNRQSNKIALLLSHVGSQAKPAEYFDV